MDRPERDIPHVARAQQGLPDRPITLVSGFSPGGSTDITARLLADRMQGFLGPNARVVVENRPGAAGTVASEWLRRQPADGTVLMLCEASSHALIPHAVAGGTRYNPMDDFTHIAIAANGLVASLATAIRSWRISTRACRNPRLTAWVSMVSPGRPPA